MDLDQDLGGTRSADLLVTAGGPLWRLVEVKSASGAAPEQLVSYLQRHLTTWPQLRPEPVTCGVLIVNHQHTEQPGFLHHGRAPGTTCLSALHAGHPGTVSNNSKGCGGVMRVAPAGLAGGDPFTLGCQAAAPTYSHPSGYLAAVYFADFERVAKWEVHDLTGTRRHRQQQMSSLKPSAQGLEASWSSPRSGTASCAGSTERSHVAGRVLETISSWPDWASFQRT